MTLPISRNDSLTLPFPLDAQDVALPSEEGFGWAHTHPPSRARDNVLETAPRIQVSRLPSHETRTIQRGPEADRLAHGITGPNVLEPASSSLGPPTRPTTSRGDGPAPAQPTSVSGWSSSSWPPVPIAPPLSNARFTGLPQLADVASGQVVLGSGSRGDGPRALQTALLNMGFALHGGADGQFGPQTVRALRNFQVHARRDFPTLKPTGTLDTATLRALDALAPEPGLKGQSQGIPPAVYDGQPVRVVVALREHRTFLYDNEGRLLDIFPNASGTTATPTRAGLKVVRARLDQAAAEAAGARLWNDRHVFGTRILDLSWADGRHSAEELHGTNAPALLGGDVSRGCIRHSNEAIVVLHDALSAGDRVAIVEHVDDPHLGGALVPVS
ncbi:L,D-transpeptidase family protein [Myxococcus qinghaiensis]|uniref:L,D-transpeptidase family protein n=1 Tax=Myxococcus qinghaiensis TaxID=2906758 RepID=UPI0020A7DA6F|nr:L,D-transpeptidase family protein [Myxococcus qinghaiensis]MCP3162703.1 L,D-transpeptidase family protein [Myxococcus qinghaiensis]